MQAWRHIDLATAMLLAMLRTFLVFFIGGLLMTAAVVSLFLVGGIVWTDCLHDNPNRTCGDALLFAAVSPVYGVMIGMAVYFLPLIVAAALAVFGRVVFRYLPLWYLLAVLPACFLAYTTQPSSWFTHDLHTLSERLLMFSAFQVPALLICWWWDQRKTWT
jgi:hypothetical protein